MWPLKTILYFVLFWAGCFLALINPIWGVVNYLLAYQTNPVSAWWGKPLAALGMRFSLLTAIFTFAGLFFGRKYVPKARPLFSLWEFGVLAIIGLATLNTVIGPVYSHHSAFAFDKMWKMLVFVLLLARLASHRDNLRLVLWALVLGSLYVGHDAYTAPASAFFQGRLNHIGGSDFSTTSGLGAHLTAMLPIIGIVFLTTRKWKWKALAAVSGAFVVNGIVLCRTRSAFIGLACGAVVALLMAPRAKRFRIRLLLALGAVAAFSLTDSFFWDRMGTLTSAETLQEDPAAISRVDIWRKSLDILADYPQGIGVGNFTSVIGVYDPLYKNRAAHNTVLLCFVELGVLGGALFLVMVAGSLFYLWRVCRLADSSENPLETKLIAYGLFVSLISYMVAGLATDRFYCESFWWVLCLPLCLYRLTAHEAMAVPAVDPEFEPDPADEIGQYVPVPGAQHG